MTTKDAELLKLTPGERAHLRIYKSNAERRGLKFELSVDESMHLFESACHYCGRTPELRRFSTSNKHAYAVEMNGIDRMDPGLGYTMQNSVPCCRACNKSKGKLGYADFLDLARRVAALHPHQ